MPTFNVTINTRDARDRRALKLLEQARQWAKCSVLLPSGRRVKAYGIPSESEPGVYRLTNLHQCSCPDFQFRQDGHGGLKCAHMRAVRWYVDYVRAEERRQALAATEGVVRRSSAKTSEELVDAF